MTALLTLADRLEKAMAPCLLCGGLRYVTRHVHYGHDWTAYVDCPHCTDAASLCTGGGMMTDAEIIKFARDFRRGILGRRSSDLMCFAVCAPLFALLEMYGVECRLIYTDLEDDDTTDLGNHVWLLLADGRALDPTGDQVGLRPVYLGPPLQYHRASPAIASGRGRGEER